MCISRALKYYRLKVNMTFRLKDVIEGFTLFSLLLYYLLWCCLPENASIIF